MHHVPLAFQCIYDAVMKEGRKWRLPCLFYADEMVLFGESEEGLRMMVRWFAEVCRRRGLKVNADKSKVRVQNGEDGLECEVHVDGIHLEHVSEFKYFGCILDMEQNIVGRW